MYSRIPDALIARMPVFKDKLADFQSLAAFEKKWGTNTPTLADYSFSLDSLDKAVGDVLLPLYTFKKHSALVAEKERCSALSVGFVKEALPTIEQLYVMESRRLVATTTNDSGTRRQLAFRQSDEDESVSDEEADRLKLEYAAAKANYRKEIATNIVKAQATITDPTGLDEAITKSAFTSDGTARLFHWDAGLQAT